MFAAVHHKTTRENKSFDLASKPMGSHPLFALKDTRLNAHAFNFNQIPIQAKLKINTPGDVYEQEADRVADKVLRMNEAVSVSQQSKPEIHRKPLFSEISSIGSFSAQRKCTNCEDEERMVQRKEKNNTSMLSGDAISNQLNATRGRGSSMDATTNRFMSSRFGHDFSHINIHQDNTAVKMSQSVNARAFTIGNDIYFNKGEYQPHSNDGKRLLAHELVHTVQQSELSENRIQRVCGRTARTISGFPETYIKHIDVNISNPCKVTLTWAGTNASSQVNGPFHATIGNGGNSYNCDDTAISNANGSNCTPKGDFIIERQACALGDYPAAKNASYFDVSRGIAFHFWNSRPDCPSSHGCVRLSEAHSELIYDNTINQNTASAHNKAATTVHVHGKWESCKKKKK